jgi:DNA-binding GntR family transcriptional regulator
MAEAAFRKQTISAQVADAIRSRILSGAYAGGFQLRQEHIAAEMGVSRIPVREALHQLHSEGFVTLVSHKGAVVSELSLDEILELHELRARVETWLLSMAIPNMTEADLARAKEAAERFGTLKYSHDLNWQFHALLYAPSKRKSTIELIGKVYQKIERYTKLMIAFATENQERSHKEHLQLIELCRSKDVLRAVNLLDMHILDNGRLLIERLTRMREKEGQDNAAL